MTLNLSFHGGVGTVTGSRHLLQAGERSVLVDAGMFQGLKALRELNWSKPIFDPASLDAVVLTHAHLDHVGYLPRLVKEGFNGPVYCTSPTGELTGLLLLDAARIQEEDAFYANKKGFTKHSPAEALFTQADAERAIQLLHPVDFHKPLGLGSGISVSFHNSGHLLGASFLEFHVDAKGKDLTMVFSGDLGRYGAPLHVDPEPRPRCDVLVVESTYGNRLHEEVALIDQLREPFLRTVERGGMIVIPAFAVGRTQQMTLVLRHFMEKGLLPEIPIHIDSPMAVEATLIYSRHARDKNLDDDVLSPGQTRLFPTNVRFHRTVEESKQLNSIEGPAVIISASGMLAAGRILHHMEKRLPDKRNLVLIAGFQAEGTRGRSLLEGARTLRLHGVDVPVKASVLNVSGMSGHADADEMAHWIDTCPEPPSTIFVVHGEAEASKVMAQRLREHLGSQVFIPAMGESHDLLAPPDRRKMPRPQVPQPAEVAPPTPQPLVTHDARELAARMAQIMGSRSYIRADRDLGLLGRSEMRAMRLQLEYMKPELTLQEQGIRSTVVVFGGTRVRERSTAQRRLDLALEAQTARPGHPEVEREVRVATRLLAMSRFYDVAREFGQIATRASLDVGGGEFVIMTGGGPGVMEAANRGAFEAGGKSIGLAITLNTEKAPNPYITPSLCFQFRYFALRKMHFMMRARAFVAFPGGYGTLDELFETLCLIQTRTIEPLPVVLVGREFWKGVFDVDLLVDEGLIEPEHAGLFSHAETAEEIWSRVAESYDRQAAPGNA